MLKREIERNVILEIIVNDTKKKLGIEEIGNEILKKFNKLFSESCITYCLDVTELTKEITEKERNIYEVSVNILGENYVFTVDYNPYFIVFPVNTSKKIILLKLVFRGHELLIRPDWIPNEENFELWLNTLEGEQVELVFESAHTSKNFNDLGEAIDNFIENIK